MKKTVNVIFISALLLLLISCSARHTPAAPLGISSATSTFTRTPARTITPTLTATMPTPTITMTQTPVPHLEIIGGAGTMTWLSYNSGFWISAPINPQPNVKISNSATPVTNAVVSINNVPLSYTSSSGQYATYVCSYISASTYTLSVYYSGVTYTATANMGGGFASLSSSDFSTLTWSSGSTSKSLSVIQGSLVNFSEANLLTSPYIIPAATAYPDSPGAYQVVVVMDNTTLMSGMTYPDYGSFSAGQSYIWNFTR